MRSDRRLLLRLDDALSQNVTVHLAGKNLHKVSSEHALVRVRSQNQPSETQPHEGVLTGQITRIGEQIPQNNKNGSECTSL